MQYYLIAVGAWKFCSFHTYYALQRGLKVLLLEKDAQPAGATVRNFGQMIPSSMAFDEWFRRGRETALLYWDLLYWE